MNIFHVIQQTLFYSMLASGLLHALTPLRKLALLLILLVFAASCSGQKEPSQNIWSQWMGENRDATWSPGIWKDTLTSADLVKRWEVPVNPGYCGPTVYENSIYLMDYAGEDPKSERVLCFDAETGEKLWTHHYERAYSVGYPTGPRASVLIAEGSAYSLGTMGDLYCLEAHTGKVLWYVNGKKEYNIDLPIWGLSSAPIIENDLLIVQLGGTPSACLVAFDKTTGAEAWANAHFVTQNEKIWAFNEKGELILGTVAPEGFNDLGRVELVKPVRVSPNPRGGVNWSHPAFAGRKIYARSDALLVCWELLE